MSNYVMERGWQDSPFFDGDEYSRRDAWEWLIANACYEEKKTRVTGKIITLQRGQLSFSIRFMAEKWGWSKSRVQRFLDSLREEGMIETRSKIGTESGTETDTVSGTAQLTITICNYSKYQLTPNYYGTRTDTIAGQIANHRRDSSGTKINTENTENTDIAAADACVRDDSKNEFQKIYETGSAVCPRLASASTAEITRWLQAGVIAERDAIPEIRRLAEKNPDIGGWRYFTSAVMQAKATHEQPLPEGKINGNQPHKPAYAEHSNKSQRAKDAVARAWERMQQTNAESQRDCAEDAGSQAVPTI